jgi:hypothetical protein
MDPVWATLFNGGVAGGVIFILLRFVIPSMLDRFGQEMAAERALHEQSLAAIVGHLEAIQEDGCGWARGRYGPPPNGSDNGPGQAHPAEPAVVRPRLHRPNLPGPLPQREDRPQFPPEDA